MKPLDILKKLKEEHLKAQYPSVPEYAIPPVKYSDKSANGLTNCIVDFLNLSGQFAERHSNEGRVIDGRKTYTDVLGRTKTIGSIKRINSSQKNGTSDIKAVIQGRMVAIEVKYGKDRQSENQKKYQKQIESAGGIYMIAKTFDDFHEKYLDLLAKLK